MAKVNILKEVKTEEQGDWNLCFQWCMYKYDDGTHDHGYRFIWRRPDGSLQAARGQARIPSAKLMNQLIKMADDAGWLGSEEE